MTLQSVGKNTTRSTDWFDVRVFSPPNNAGPSRIPPPPEDEPKPTASEIKKAFQSHISQRNGPDAPLMTQAMREREEARLGLKKKEYSHSRVRIRFSDRTILECSLPATAQIGKAYDFVRSHLDAQSKGKNFILYQTPPKRDFPERTKDVKLHGKSLKELGMVPQASLNVRWELSQMNSNSFPAPINEDARGVAETLPSPPTFDEVSSAQAAEPNPAPPTKEEEQKKTMPKWLKGLQKK